MMTTPTELTEAADRAKRAAFIEWLGAGGLPDLADDKVMERAWSRRHDATPPPIAT